MAALEFRPPSENEVRDFLSVPLTAYAMNSTDEEIDHEQLTYEASRNIGAWDGSTYVGASGAFTFDLTIPGGAQVPAAGITMIGVTPTHRRRGILTQMLTWLHDDAAQRGDVIAVLTASEASIYRRFGYGVATESTRLHVPTDAVVFEPPLNVGGGFHLVDPHVDTSELADVYRRVQQNRVGWFTRSAPWWAKVSHDPRHSRDHATKLFAVVHTNEDGRADGYATWRVSASIGEARTAENTVVIQELAAEDPTADLALWEFLASIDLATSITWDQAPTDSPMRWRIAEPRQVHVQRRTDWMWARLLDVAAVMSRRTYNAPGTLVLDIADPFRPASGGTFRLTAPAIGTPGICERTDGSAVATSDSALQMLMPELSTLVFGGVAPSMLAAAGRVTPSSSDALALADAMFLTQPAPHCPLEF